MKSDFRPVVGHRFKMRRQPRPDLDVVVDCEVLEIEPDRRLAYAWKAFDLDGVVTWTLTPTSAGTRLRMEQSGFRPEQKRAWGGARVGLNQAIDRLEQVLAEMD